MSSQNTSVEYKIVNNIIPTTKRWGIISAIIAGVGLLVSGQVIMAILMPILYYSSVMAFLVLLEGYAEIISLLRKISINGNTQVMLKEVNIKAIPTPSEGSDGRPLAVQQPDLSTPRLSIPKSAIAEADLSTAEKCIELLRHYQFTVTEPAPGQWCITSLNNSTTTYAYSVSELRRQITALSVS